MSYVVFFACVWEAVALSTRRIPTITHLVHENRGSWWCVAAVLGAVAWLLWHLLLEARGA